ncbi:MAG: hypothetical protein DRP08_05200 [Candidatus Aenigmatarchaeota archaeon]|nr:MAG: hypothetical protein DRP08_05200 [Candidatus Aenigmarchaeota archaeon]
MKVVQAWVDFLRQQPELRKRFEQKMQENPDDINVFLEEVADFQGRCYERAEEYGPRIWRIPGRKYHIIVEDVSNGWMYPVGVEIEVRFCYTPKEGEK